MHTMKLEKNVAFIREESKLIPDFKQETTIKEAEIHKDFSFWVEPYKQKIAELEKDNYILWRILPKEMHRLYIDAVSTGYLPTYTTPEKVPFYKRIFRRFLQQPCGVALIFAAIFLTYMKLF